MRIWHPLDVEVSGAGTTRPATRYHHTTPMPYCALLSAQGASPSVESLNNQCPWYIGHWSDWIYQVPCIAVLALNCIFLVFIMYVSVLSLVLRRILTYLSGREECFSKQHSFGNFLNRFYI